MVEEPTAKMPVGRFVKPWGPDRSVLFVKSRTAADCCERN